MLHSSPTENDKERPTSPERLASDTHSEIEEYTAVSKQRRRVLPRAALVGVCSGLAAGLFRLVLAGADRLRTDFIVWAHQFPYLGWLFPVLISAMGAVLSVAIVRRFAPEASGSGIPHLKAVLHRFRQLSWVRLLPTKFMAGILALGSGMALGREGPTVQMGGAVGDAVSGWLKVLPRERRTLTAAGAGAGLAAAFNAPLSGLTFVLEEVQRDFHPIVFAAAFIAAVVADIVARLLAGPDPVFLIPRYPSPPTLSLPFFALLGAISGGLGVLFNRSLIASLNFSARFVGRQKLAFAGVIGAIIGLIGWYSPDMVGGGHALSETVLAGQLGLAVIPLVLTLRFIMTVSSYSTGAAGGIFAPLLVLGALLGLAVGEAAHLFFPGVVPVPAVFAVVGMAALFTAIVRAPLTGILLIVEMTGNYDQMLPLLVSSFFAYAVAELWKEMPIYEALMERDLALNGPLMNLKEPMVIDFEIERGSPFDGREVRMLGLPPGCVLVRCLQGGRELVPTAGTRLEAHMKITAVIAPQAAHGLEILHRGCRASRVKNIEPE